MKGKRLCRGYKVQDALSIPPLNEKSVYQKYVLVKYETDAPSAIITFTNVEVYIVPDGLGQIRIYAGVVDGPDGTIRRVYKLTLKIRVSFINSNAIDFGKFDKFNFKVD